jgi:hypothetical protein
MLENIQENAVIYLSALLAISEGLALIPALKNKGILVQVIAGLGKALKIFKK